MGNLPVPIDHLVNTIGRAIVEAAGDQWESVGIAAGSIGTECDRALWYELHRASVPEAIGWQLHRIFERGNIEEDRLIELLRLIGCDVTCQQERVRNCAGHLRGKIDGQATGIPAAPVAMHVVECKSSNAKGYAPVAKHGVKEAKPLHYATMQFYMHGRGLDRCLYMMSNKDNEDIHTERVKYDAAFAERLIERVNRIIGSGDPPSKLHENPNAKAAFGCKFCNHLAVCHENKFPRVHCRTCLHVTAELSGDAHWSCARWNKPLSLDEQAAGCEAHLFIPSVVPGVQIDSSEAEEWVEYKLHDGREWKDGVAV